MLYTKGFTNRPCLHDRRRDVCWEGTFAGREGLLGRNVCWDGTFAGKGRLHGRDVCWDGMIAGKG